MTKESIIICLIRCAQTKILLFISFNNRVSKGKQTFFASSAVFSCNMLHGNKVKISFRKNISICTACTVLIRLISSFLYDLRWTHGGSNSWERPTTSGTKMEQWSLTLLPIGKPRAVGNMASLFLSWHFECSACACRPINREWCSKYIQCDNI